MGTQVGHLGQHLSINNLPVRATLSYTARKLHEGSLRDLMSGPSWILAELIGAVPKGQKKGHLLTKFWQPICMYTKSRGRTLRVSFGGWGRDPGRGVFFSCKE